MPDDASEKITLHSAQKYKNIVKIFHYIVYIILTKLHDAQFILSIT